MAVASGTPDPENLLARRLTGDLPVMVAFRSLLDRGGLRALLRGALQAPANDLALIVLRGAGVIESDAAGFWRLTPAMAALWRADGPVIEARLRFTLLAASDLLHHGEALFSDKRAFVGKAATYGFFRYARAAGTGAAQIEDTEPWVRYVTALNAAEAPVLAPLIPVVNCVRLLEVGGNTGGFALALLALHPRLRAGVMDLPAVCHIGARDSAGHPDAGRLQFLPGDARAPDWPMLDTGRPDAILFKSVLHDWEGPPARDILARAADHLAPGGRLIICERGPMADEPHISGLEAAANIVFAPFYRDPAVYEKIFRDLALSPLPRQSARLDMTFHVLTAVKPA